MYRPNKLPTTTLKINNSYTGEPLEAKLRKLVNNKEPLDQQDTAPLIFTERNDGVLAAYDIRTDRWEIAVDAKDAVTKDHQAKRKQRHKTETGSPEIGKEAAKGMAAEGQSPANT